MTPISLQLYSLREASAKDFDAVLGNVARIGYQGVEPFDLFGRSAGEFRRQVEALGMTVSSSHFPWATRTDVAQIVDVAGSLGLNRAIGGFGPDEFKDLDTIKHTAEFTRGLLEQLQPQGIELTLHNHYWEFALVEGRPAYHHFQALVPEITFEIDTYWAANFGAVDPAAEVARVSKRTPLLHIKDGPLSKGEANVAVGSGRMDVFGVIEAADPQVLEWLVVEFDRCDTDMLTAVEQSYRYLVRNTLGDDNV